MRCAMACLKWLDQPRVIWLIRISTVRRSHCDVLGVRALILSFTDRNGRSPMKV